MPHMTKTNMTKANATKATKAKETKAKANPILGKRSYEAKMLRKYDHMVKKRNRDKCILQDRKLKDWILEI